ncbi:MAG: LCCL domain-containing protein [Polyangiales bacterium]
MEFRLSRSLCLVAAASLLPAAAGCKRSSNDSAPAPQPAPAAGEVMPNVNWRTQARAFRGRNGLVVTVTCPPGGPAGTVWGSDIYTDDSSVCGAALHSGRINQGAGGTFQIQILPGQQAYVATVRNGVTTTRYGRYAGSFSIVGGAAPGMVAVPVPTNTPPPVAVPTAPPGGGAAPLPAPPGRGPWATNAVAVRGQNGRQFFFGCPPNGTPSTVWGTGTYTDDSSVCGAAVHAGIINAAQGGNVTITVAPGLPAYVGSTANGVTTQNYGSYGGSFVFAGARPPAMLGNAPPGAITYNWTQAATPHRGRNGQAFRVYCPPGGSPGTVWGTGVYTDDSSVCGAAAHAGRITLAQGGAFTLRILPGLPAYRGSTANGVTTQNYGNYPGSFSIQP